YAVVTGGNKGIGFEICRQLAAAGVVVVLTARDENRGLAAVQQIRDSGISDDLVIFHKLDVVDPDSIACLADFVKARFGKLDILVNNAGVLGVEWDTDGLQKAVQLAGGFPTDPKVWDEISTQAYDWAQECLEINYYGAKRMAETFIQLLQASDSPRIVNVTGSLGLLKNIPNEWAKGILSDLETLTEGRVEEVVNVFLKDFEKGLLEEKGWPIHFSAYTVSKAATNAYTMILAKRYPNFRVNCLDPGFCKTDIMTTNIGTLTPAEGAVYAVRLALLPNGGPTGANKGIGFEVCRQLAAAGVVVVLTARDENRGLAAVHKLIDSGVSDDLVVFHKLDVVDPDSVNNAGVLGVEIDAEGFDKAVQVAGGFPSDPKVLAEIATQTYELAQECVETSYYGARRTAEAFIPLLLASDSPRIVNVSGSLGLLKNINNEWAKGLLNDVESLTEERVDEVVNQFLKDFKEGLLETNGWPSLFPAATLAKASMNAHTRILARKYPRICVNAVCPGFTKTDLTKHHGRFTAAEGAEHAVRLALLSPGAPSGNFYVQKEVSSF
ncbi:hypothetical protein Tsubulata_048354, partial [Turnera subulata]